MKSMALVKNSPYLAVNNNELNRLAQSLIGYLVEEINNYYNLHELLKKEKEILKNPSIDDLNANNSLKEKCVIKAGICRDCSEELIMKIKKKYYDDCSGNISITQISKYLEYDIKKQLMECCRKLYTIANNVKKVNHRNRSIIMNSILYSRSSLNFLQKNKSFQINYRRSGQLDISLSSGSIFNRNI